MNLELVEQIVALMSEHPVSEITVEQEGRCVRICRPMPAAPFTPMPLAAPQAGGETEAVTPISDLAEAQAVLPETHTLTATMVGIFHHPVPPLPYAALITPGQTIGSIESMKLMNEVAAEWGGRVLEVLTEDGAPVEYGQPLFRLAAA